MFVGRLSRCYVLPTGFLFAAALICKWWERNYYFAITWLITDASLCSIQVGKHVMIEPTNKPLVRIKNRGHGLETLTRIINLTINRGNGL